MTTEATKVSWQKLHSGGHKVTMVESGKFFKEERGPCLRLYHKFLGIINYDGIKDEARKIASISWAIILTTFLLFFLQSTSVIMSGSLSPIELDSVALASSVYGVLGEAIINGMSTAFDTFFSQSYGAGKKKAVGIYLQRAIILSYLVMVCLYCIYVNLEPILVAIGQDKIKSMIAGEYFFWLCPGVFFLFTFQILARYLQNQGYVISPMLCTLLGNIVNISSQYITIHVFKVSYIASAICQSASLGVMVVSVLTYILLSGIYRETWSGWKLEYILTDWGGFMRIAIPGILFISFEGWFLQIGIIISGLLGTVQMGAQAILLQLQGWMFMLPFGLSIAVSIRVGQKLGTGDIQGAQLVFKLAMFIISAINIIVISLMIAFLGDIPRIFTRDSSLIEVAISALRIYIIAYLFTCVAQVTLGVLRGCGHQLVGAVVNFVSFYIIGLPVSVSLALITPLGVSGFWIGITAASVSQAVSFCIYMYRRINWPEESRKAQIHARASLDGPRSETEKDSDSQSKNTRKFSHEREALVSSLGETGRRRIINLRHLYVRRIFTCFVVVVMFTGSLTARIFVPKTWRLSCMPVNNETIQIHFPPLPLCNFTDIAGRS